MYSTSRITDGIGIENRAECSQRAELSSAFATPLRISTTARRAVQTLIGSNDALSTKTRDCILKAKYNLVSSVLSKVTVALRARPELLGKRWFEFRRLAYHNPPE